MSDDTTTAPPAPTTGDGVADEPLGEAGKKALVAERDGRKAAEKAAADAAVELQAMRDALALAQASSKDSQELAATATSKAMRLQVAVTHGITADDAETFLTGADESTLTKQAERLKALSKPSGIPLPDPTQGARDSNLGGGELQEFATSLFNSNRK